MILFQATSGSWVDSRVSSTDGGLWRNFKKKTVETQASGTGLCFLHMSLFYFLCSQNVRNQLLLHLSRWDAAGGFCLLLGEVLLPACDSRNPPFFPHIYFFCWPVLLWFIFPSVFRGGRCDRDFWKSYKALKLRSLTKLLLNRPRLTTATAVGICNPRAKGCPCAPQTFDSVCVSRMIISFTDSLMSY